MCKIIISWKEEVLDKDKEVVIMVRKA